MVWKMKKRWKVLVREAWTQIQNRRTEEQGVGLAIRLSNHADKRMDDGIWYRQFYHKVMESAYPDIQN
jgi:hypothetical protein